MCIFLCSDRLGLVCDVLPSSVLDSSTSLRGPPWWDFIFMRKVFDPPVTRSWRMFTVSFTRSSSGVGNRVDEDDVIKYQLWILDKDFDLSTNC